MKARSARGVKREEGVDVYDDEEASITFRGLGVLVRRDDDR